MSFTIDNSLSITGTYTPPDNVTSVVHHTPFWVSPTLNNSQHTLVITQTTAQPAGNIFLDYLMYNTTSTSVGAYFVDDRDLRVTYTPPWTLQSSEDYFQHTQQASNAVGDSFSLAFEGACYSAI